MSKSPVLVPQDAVLKEQAVPAGLSSFLAQLSATEQAPETWACACPKCAGAMTVYLVDDPFIGRAAVRVRCHDTGCEPWTSQALDAIEPDAQGVDWSGFDLTTDVGRARALHAMIQADGKQVRYSFAHAGARLVPVGRLTVAGWCWRTRGSARTPAWRHHA